VSSHAAIPQRTRGQELLAAAVRVPQHVVFRSFPVETVVLNLSTGTYHGLNPVGGRMLEALGREATVGAAAASVARSYSQPLEEVERDVCELCAMLLERGLIELDPPRRG
jgi:Coenzyme PQQ synthesis protein D (PqqD)